MPSVVTDPSSQGGGARKCFQQRSGGGGWIHEEVDETMFDLKLGKQAALLAQLRLVGLRFGIFSGSAALPGPALREADPG
jgi:hypothetical protein